ncbi:MAG: hypothetical protein NVS2B11_08640 [Acetobacteraceae bacterium]
MEEAGLALVGLDLTAKTGDLDVDGALAGLVHVENLDNFLAGEDLAGLAGEDLQEGGLAAGEVDGAVGAGELGAFEVELEAVAGSRLISAQAPGGVTMAHRS